VKKLVVGFTLSPDVVARLARLSAHLLESRSTIVDQLLDHMLPGEHDPLPPRLSMAVEVPRLRDRRVPPPA
jgi:hypothetical protein